MGNRELARAGHWALGIGQTGHW